METWEKCLVEVSSEGRIRLDGGVVFAYMPSVKIVQRDSFGMFVRCYGDLDEIPFKRSAVLNCLRGRQSYHQGYSFSYV